MIKSSDFKIHHEMISKLVAGDISSFVEVHLANGDILYYEDDELDVAYLHEAKIEGDISKILSYYKDEDSGNITFDVVWDCKGNIRWIRAYRISRAYGGPAEGGDYYDAGELICQYPVKKEYPWATAGWLVKEYFKKEIEALRDNLSEMEEFTEDYCSTKGGYKLEISCSSRKGEESYPTERYRYE